MKTLDELKDLYYSIPDLKVSEEMLCAHAEGTLSASEDEDVVSMIEGDEYLSELCSEVSDTTIDYISEADADTAADAGSEHPDLIEMYDMYMSSSQPSGSADGPETETIIGDYAAAPSESDDGTKNFLAHDDISAPDVASITSEPNQTTMAKGSNKNFGLEPNKSESKYDLSIDQGNRPSCAVKSQEVVLRDYGIVISEEELIDYATKQGWYDDDPEYGGTPRAAVGNLLEACGIPTVRTENATIYDIIAELRAGHRVIVSVDAEELWVKKEPVLYKRLFGEVVNRIQDAADRHNGVLGANHALVVSGVTVNTKDPSDIHVTLTDTGSGDFCIQYRLKDFMNALEDSNCYMVSTTIPAPYQYNFETKMMEPSSFNTSYYPSMATLPEGLHNRFSLDDSFYDKYADYQSVYDTIDVPAGDIEAEHNACGNLAAHHQSTETDSRTADSLYNDSTDTPGDYDDSVDPYNDNDDEGYCHDTASDCAGDSDDYNDATLSDIDNPVDDGGDY